MAEYTPILEASVDAFIYTRKSRRRTGLATRLLVPLLARAESDGTREFRFHTVDEIEGGRPFAERLGATVVHGDEIAELDLRALDLVALRTEEAARNMRATAFELLFYDAFPSEHAAALAVLTDAVWGYALGFTTAESLQCEWQAEAERGAARWLLLARERSSGGIVGCFQGSWDVATPAQVAIEFAGVHPDHRRTGLFSFLTVSFIRRLAERESFRVARYRTRHDNVAVLTRGRAMDFKPYQTYWTWRIEPARVASYCRR